MLIKEAPGMFLSRVIPFYITHFGFLKLSISGSAINYHLPGFLFIYLFFILFFIAPGPSCRIMVSGE